jgi:glycolate oxidase iron-sulfur subunit
MDSHGLPCVHCGLCLDTCPTYRVLGTEADSPRGRIYLMEAIEAGSLPLDAAATAHLDGCLGCLACETACPSGVGFGDRIEAVRPRLKLSGIRELRRRAARYASASPSLLRAGLLVARALDALGLEHARRSLPALGLMPRNRSAGRLPRLAPSARSRIAAPTAPRATAVLLVGCAADVLRPQVTRAAVEALHRNGVRVVDVASQECCGALALHSGRIEAARSHVRVNTTAFAGAHADFVVSTAAGCGAMLKRYDKHLPQHDPLQASASALARKARDVSEVLTLIGIAAPTRPLEIGGPVAYHDACHLLNVGAVASAPRAVIAAATGVAPVDLGENSICCGSAGSYNLEHPHMANELGARKAQLAGMRGAKIVAVGNVGCMLQIERALALRGDRTPVVHPVEMLADAYVAEKERR